MSRKSGSLLVLALALGVVVVSSSGPHLPTPQWRSRSEPSIHIKTLVENSSESIPHDSLYRFEADECLPALESVAFSRKVDLDLGFPGEDFVVPPPSPWILESEVPSASEVADGVVIVPELIQIRQLEAAKEVWIRYAPHVNRKTLSDDRHNFYFAVFNTSTGEWRRVPAFMVDVPVVIGEIFISPDNVIWGRNVWYPASGESYPAVSRYNDDRNEFEFVPSSTIVPYGDGKDNSLHSFFGQVLMDSRGVFWFVISGDGLYSFTPVSGELTLHYRLVDVDVSFASLERNDRLLLIVNLNGMVFSNRDHQLMEFDQESGELIEIPYVLQAEPIFNEVYLDRFERLWFDAIGWLDADGEWYQIVPPALFLTNTVWDGFDSRWKVPQMMTQTSDDRLWFKNDNGLMWLDMEKEQWCWFTTAQSEVIEDQDRIVWILHDDRLFRLDLSSQ